MVDHRADERGPFNYLELSGAWRTGLLDRAADWLTTRLAPGQGDHAGNGEAARGWRLPIAVSAIWLMALGAYAVGYFGRLDAAAEAGAVRALPVLDLMFFGFAAVGPVAMLWMVSLLQTRAARLSDALTAQSDSALALAATVANLHEAVDALAEGTTGKLADTSARVEREAQEMLDKLDRATATLAGKIDKTMLGAVVSLERALRERTARADAALDAQRDAWVRRLDEDASRLAAMIHAAAEAIGEAHSALAERIAADLAEHGTRIEHGTAGLLAALRERLDGIGTSVDEALGAMAGKLAEAERARQAEVEGSLRQREARLVAAVGTAARTVEGDVAPLLAEIRAALAETRDTIAANPPAGADELASLLGEAADRRVAPERAALDGALDRIAALEGQARDLLERIDRTSRLNPLMAPGEVATAATAPANIAGPELPFAALPRDAGRAALDWTAAIRALSGRPTGEATRPAVERAGADPDVAAVRDLAARAAVALAEDGLHIADVSPHHSTAALWHRFATGERGGEIGALAGIEDEVALAIARARLRDDPEFRALALRLVGAYARLIERAGSEIGADPRLVELADTPPGRAFALLAGMTGALRPVPVTTE